MPKTAQRSGSTDTHLQISNTFVLCVCSNPATQPNQRRVRPLQTEIPAFCNLMPFCHENGGFAISHFEFYGLFARLSVTMRPEEVQSVCCSFAALPRTTFCHFKVIVNDDKSKKNPCKLKFNRAGNAEKVAGFRVDCRGGCVLVQRKSCSLVFRVHEPLD